MDSLLINVVHKCALRRCSVSVQVTIAASLGPLTRRKTLTHCEYKAPAPLPIVLTMPNRQPTRHEGPLSCELSHVRRQYPRRRRIPQLV
jgi:hypothetical protein